MGLLKALTYFEALCFSFVPQAQLLNRADAVAAASSPLHRATAKAAPRAPKAQKYQLPAVVEVHTPRLTAPDVSYLSS